jgi:aspartate 1-decarboxylase
MQRVIMRSKIHLATVTRAEVDTHTRNRFSEQAIA